MNNVNQPPQGPQIDLNNTTAIKTKKGKSIFQQGVILRQVSKFVAGNDEDALLPIPVFYDKETGKILKDTLPPELRDEYDTI